VALEKKETRRTAALGNLTKDKLRLLSRKYFAGHVSRKKCLVGASSEIERKGVKKAKPKGETGGGVPIRKPMERGPGQ